MFPLFHTSQVFKMDIHVNILRCMLWKKKRNVHPNFVFKREVTNKLPWEKLTKREVEIDWNNFTLKIYQNLDTLNWDEKG